MHTNGWQYEKLGVLEHQTFNLLRYVFSVKMFIFTAFCPIFYIEVEDKEKTMDAISEEDVKDAEEALENASIKGEENVKAEVEKREVPAPEKVKKVKKIKQPKKIKTGSSKPAKKTKQIAEKKTIPAGWQIQLAAVSSYKNAENEWNRLRILHPLLKKQTHEIFEKNIHGKKIYRLRVVGMSSRDSADSLCADLQTEGLACLVMR